MLIAIQRRKGDCSFNETCQKMMEGFLGIGQGITMSWQDELIPGEEIPDIAIGIATAASFNQFKLIDPNASVRVGYCVWESTKIPKQFKNDMEDIDIIITPSAYCRDIFIKEKLKDPEDIYVCPDGINTTFYRPIVRPIDRMPFRILDVGVIQYRKGHDILLKAFSELSDEMQGKMQLIIKGRPIDEGKYGEGIVKKYRGHSDIRIIENRLSPMELLGLYHAADLFVHPHRSEGYGLPPLEAMRTGLPIITTDYSGIKEYCTKDNSYFIQHSMVKPPKETGYEGEMAEADKDHLIALIRYIFENRKSVLVKAAGSAKALGNMTLQWSAQNIYNAIKDYMTRHSIRTDAEIGDKNKIFEKIPKPLRVLWT